MKLTVLTSVCKVSFSVDLSSCVSHSESGEKRWVEILHTDDGETFLVHSLRGKDYEYASVSGGG